MADTTAIRAQYGRIITSKRSGTCHTCGGTTEANRDLAAVTASGAWHAYCLSCARSYVSQVAGLVGLIEAAAETAPQEVQDALVLPDEAAIVSVIEGGASPAQAYDVVLKLIELKNTISTGKALATPLVQQLQAVANDSSAQPRDRSFASSLADQLVKKGQLSEKQLACAERLVKTATVTVTHQAGGPLEEGLYLCEKGLIRKVYTTQNDRLACKLLHVDEKSHNGSLTYEVGGLRTLRNLVAEGKAHHLTEEEAARFGKLHGFCVNCARDLDDDRSLAVGYGPVCAKRYGWFYPNAAQAADLLARPAG